jgi:hypothetical protein
MTTFDDKFKIALFVKKIFIYIYDISYNIPKKDAFLKNKLIDNTYELLKYIYLANYLLLNNNLYMEYIKTDISLLDYFLEIIYTKKYINKKQLDYLGHYLLEVNKMATSWIKNKEKNNA